MSALIALQLPPGGFVAALRQAWDDGNAVLPLPQIMPPAGRERILARLRPALLVDGHGIRELDGAVPTAPETALVVATSGSTGEPKGVELPRAGLESSARLSVQRLGLGPADRWLCCLPLHYIAGLQVLQRATVLGTPPIIHTRFDEAAIAAEAEATAIAVVPTMLTRLLDAHVDLARFSTVLVGGGPTSPALLHRATATGARVVTTYGMTETSGGCVYDGIPLDGVEVRVDDDGRIAIRGPVLMTGYRLAPHETAAVLSDGWLRTRDVGEWDGRRLRVLGRVDDVIITGGEKVLATEVAEVLADHPMVVEAAVVGREDERWGERVVAYVVAAGVPPAVPALRGFVADRLGRAHAPREVIFVDALPRLPSGKTARPG